MQENMRQGWMKTDWSLSKKFGPKELTVTIRIINSEIRMRYMNYVKLDTYAEEHVFLLIFDFKMHFKSFIEIGIGTNRVCVIDRGGIAQKVLILNAGAFVVVHNHPSGDPTPSESDIDAARKIDEIGQLIDIHMKDFMMIGSETYYSVKENEDI